MKTKEMRAKRAKLVADARAITDSVKDGEALTAEQSAKFDEIMAAADVLKADIDRIENLEDAEAQLGARQERRAGRESNSPDEAAAARAAQSAAFDHYLRHGMASMTPEMRALAQPRFQNALSTGNDSAGGYTVPDGFLAQLEGAMLAFGGMLDVAYSFSTTSGNDLLIPTENDTSNEGAILGENPTSQPEQDVQFGAVKLGAHTYTSKMIRVPNQLLQDSAFDLPAFLSGKLGERLARRRNRDMTVGDGSSKPWGAVTMSTAGVTAAATDLSPDNLIELHHSVDPAYRSAARFMMNDNTLLRIKKKKDGTGRYLWQSGIAIREPDTIDGKPYTINQHMADVGTGTKSVLFGDFKKYYIRNVAGPLVLRLNERYAELNQTAFVAFMRTDGVLVDAGTHPLKHIVHA